MPTRAPEDSLLGEGRRLARAGTRESTGPRFFAIGLDHTTAGIELRERLAFEHSEIPGVLRRLTDPEDRLVEQAAILSTCNRVELYGVARWRPDEGRLACFLAEYHGIDPSSLVGALCVDRDAEVPRRLAATAAGMRSLVLGEPQIQGQVRRALELAIASGTAGAELRRLFESAIAAGRRVRSRTTIGLGAASVPYAGVELARRRLGTLSRATVLVIGTGTVGELLVKQIVRCGARQLFILGRSGVRAQRLAEAHGAWAISPDRLDEALVQADVVITATCASVPWLHRDRLRRAVAARGDDCTPLLLLDLSVPRNVDSTASDLSGLEVHTIDELRGVVERSLGRRQRALPQAEEILESEVRRFIDWLRRREVSRRPDSLPVRPDPGLRLVTDWSRPRTH